MNNSGSAFSGRKNFLAHPILYGLTILAVCYLYEFTVKTPAFGVGGGSYDSMIVSQGNLVFGWAAVWCLTGTFILGSIAKLLPKPLKFRPLVSLLNSRKALGLIGCLYACIHMCEQFVFFNPHMYGSYYYKNDDGSRSTTNMMWWGQLVILFGILSMIAMIPMVISSFSGSYTRREWYVVQSLSGLIMMLFSIGHVTILGLPPTKSGWRDLFSSRSHGWPASTIYSALALYLAVFLRLVVFVVRKCLPRDGRLQNYSSA